MAEGIYKKGKREHRVDALERTLKELDLKEVHDELYKSLEELVLKNTKEVILGNKAELEETKTNIRKFYYNIVLDRLTRMEHFFTERVKNLQESNKKLENSFGELESLITFALLPWYKRLWYTLTGKKNV